ncbi:MAG: MFS transporter [Clostridia bacterium]|nr:MFS transporter [Clostridia bacterium]
MKPIFKNEKTAFVWLCAAVYFVSYLTRNSYSSVIPEITESLSISEEAVGIVGTSAFLTYGIGQIVCGILADKFSPKKIVLIGIITTACCNLLMPFLCSDVVKMVILWGVNGFAQAMFWPPLVRIMAERLEKSEFDKAVVTVTTASAIGNILLYTLSPLSIAYIGWKPIFFTVSAVAVIVAIVWAAGSKSHKASEKSVTKVEQSPSYPYRKIIIASGMIMILLAIVLMGILRDGLATWMPSLVADEFELSNSVSIFTAVLLPAFAIIGIKCASALQSKVKNELLTAALIFAVSLVCAAVLLAVFYKSVVVSVVLMAFITAAMHGINLILISRVPIHYAKYGKISTVSGVLNAFTYIGAALSSYGFARFSTEYGWYFIIGSWAVLTLLGTVVCLLISRRWKRFSEQGI